MISAYLYVFAAAVLLPFLWWQQVEESRNYVLMLLTGLFLSYWILINRFPFHYDITTIAVIAFSIWMGATMFWTDSRQSWFELLTWMSCMVVFLVSASLPKAHLLPMIFSTGVIFAAFTLFYMLRTPDPYKFKKEFFSTSRSIQEIRRAIPRMNHYFILGNTNHFGAFMLVYVFVGLWLTVNASLWYTIPTLIIATVLGFTKSRGALVAFFVAAYVVLCMTTPWAILAAPVALLGAWLAMKFNYIGRPSAESTGRRAIFYIGSLLLIKQKPFTGHGLRTFRKEYPSIIPTMMANQIVKRIIKHVGKINGTETEAVKSHRAHNDHLETVVESGIIGYVLLLVIFATLGWAINPILAGVVVAFAINGLFFFPLREVHTAVPFWAATGAMATSLHPPAGMGFLISIVLVLVIGRIMFKVIKKFRGLYVFYQLSRLRTPEAIKDKTPDHIKMDTQRRHLLDMAINDDPYNNDYLSNGYFFNLNAADPNPALAFQYASRCIENYDGGKVKWGIFDQYARAVLVFGGFNIARLALQYCLYLCPGFVQAEHLIKQIDEAEKKGQGIQVQA